MPLSIKTNLSKTKLRSKTTTKSIANKEEKQKAFSSFCTNPVEFDFESYSINLVGIFAFAQASGQEIQLHNALVERVANQFRNDSTGIIDLPTKMTFDVNSGTLHEVIDDGKNKSLRYLMMNWRNGLGKNTINGLLDTISVSRKKKVTKK